MAPVTERERRVRARGPLNICSECGQVNPLDGRICRGCGTSLVVAQEPARREPARPEPAQPGPSQPELLGPPADEPAELARARRPMAAAAPVAVLTAVAVAVLVIVASTGGAPGHATRRAAERIVQRTPTAVARKVVHAPAPASHAVTRTATPTQRARPAAPVRQRHAVRSAPPADPLATVGGYWRDIARHDFAGAYSQLAPGSVDMSEAQFVAYEEQTGVQSAAFSGRTLSGSGSAATVVVSSLVTRDRRFGCQSWSGSYLVSRENGVWRIARAAIAPGPCPVHG